MQSSLGGSERMSYERKVVVTLGLRGVHYIASATWPFLQDHYASQFSVNDKMREEQYHRKTGQNPITGTAQISVGYDGVANKLQVTGCRGAPTNDERNWLKMTHHARTVERCAINDSLFYTEYCTDFQFDISVIKSTYYFDLFGSIVCLSMSYIQVRSHMLSCVCTQLYLN